MMEDKKHYKAYVFSVLQDWKRSKKDGKQLGADFPTRMVTGPPSPPPARAVCGRWLEFMTFQAVACPSLFSLRTCLAAAFRELRANLINIQDDVKFIKQRMFPELKPFQPQATSDSPKCVLACPPPCPCTPPATVRVKNLRHSQHVCCKCS